MTDNKILGQEELPEIKNPLPEAVMRAWGENTMQDLGGFMQMAGGDPQKAFSSKNVTDHIWLNTKVRFPVYGDSDLVGVIVSCIIHPRGELMFDVKFNKKISSISYWANEGWTQSNVMPMEVQRFRSSKLIVMAEVIS